MIITVQFDIEVPPETGIGLVREAAQQAITTCETILESKLSKSALAGKYRVTFALNQPQRSPK